MPEIRTQVEQLGQVLAEYQQNPVGFFHDLLKVHPDPWQAEALQALADGKNVSIRSGHGVGKTCLLAGTLLWFIATRSYPKIPCTAPTQHQLSDLLWAEVSTLLSRSPLKAIINWTATKVALRGSEGSWFAVARSCTRPENLAGFHAEHLLYIVDEASGVPDEIMQAVDGALTTESAQILMAGNPTQLAGYFHRSHHEGRSLWHTIHVSSEQSPRVDPAYPKMMAEKWGRDSDIYRVRVLGDFPQAQSDSFIRLDLVEAAIRRYQDDPDGLRTGQVEIGVDVARYGDDETVFVVRDGGLVTLIERARGWSVTQTAGRAMQLARDYGAESVNVDDTGVGGGVTDILNENGGAWQIYPRNFGGPGDDYYANETGRLWGFLRDALTAGRMAVPPDPDLPGQLSTRKFRVNPKGKIALESKDDMRRRGRPSPDIADALCLAFASVALGNTPPATAEIAVNYEPRPEEYSWI